MNIFCLEDFKVEFENLITKKSYRDLQNQIIDYFFDKSVADLTSGTRLNNSDDAPYIKKRLAGSGGYRVYFLLLIREECAYIMFVHPKTGSMGSSNITDDSKALLYKKVYESIKSSNLFELTLNKEKDEIIFTRMKPKK